MTLLRKIAEKLSYSFNWVAGAGLVAIMLLTCSDVILRFFGRPIPGTFEIVGFLGAFVAAFAIAYTQVLRGHVAIDYLIDRMPHHKREIMRGFIYLVSAGFFSLLAWQSFLYGVSLSLSGEVSPTEKIPLSPFVYGIALACLPMILLLLANSVKSFVRVVKA
jgi:TRAP-type C4-dicarboxylate transport system permease small subunit